MLSYFNILLIITSFSHYLFEKAFPIVAY